MDRDVLAQLYERYYQPALFYLLALCRDRHLAEDLVQEAFVRAYLSLPEDVPSFPYWLMPRGRGSPGAGRRCADAGGAAAAARGADRALPRHCAPFGGRAGAFEPVLLRAAAAQ